MRHTALRVLLGALVCLGGWSAVAQEPAPPAMDPLHRPFDEILDIYVRDGLVYYHALKLERPRFDRYVASLDVAPAVYQAWTPPRQLAFWLNAYNAFVLRTVIDHYPIRGRAPQYPASSIRQIPGAFEARTFRAAGRTVTLDGIEKEILPGFGDARAYLVLGRGAVGSMRLRSEAFTGERLDAQLSQAAAESVTRHALVQVDQVAGVLSASPVFSWREPMFVASFADRAPATFATRSAIERAILALVDPHLVTSERDYLRRNDFRVVFHEFDWAINDLTNRP
ncbi:MAG: DUF547 domain-containing protein [Vicinamibacterales bacterium]|nr:DUF547 domain-containing protein [Vicinamibacterales bacterium]